MKLMIQCSAWNDKMRKVAQVEGQIEIPDNLVLTAIPESYGTLAQALTTEAIRLYSTGETEKVGNDDDED